MNEDWQSLAAQVTYHWGLHNVSMVEDRDAIKLAMKVKPNLSLPPWFIDFHRAVGLMANNDHEGFLFWSPNDCRFADDYGVTANFAFSISEACVIFADYMQESWWYGLWVKGPWVGMVSPIWGSLEDSVVEPIGTFSEFIKKYLVSDTSLFPKD